MNSSEILELVRAGYTKEEIKAMDQQPTPTPTPEKKDDPEPEKIEVPDKKKDGSGSSEDLIPENMMKVVNDKFDELKKMIQDDNFRKVDNPDPEQPAPLDAVGAAKQFWGVE